jgi:formyltetrahydrofolate deformylase
MLELCSGRAELLVLARYMQILSSDFPERVGMPAITIHHSFLPAFTGNDTSADRDDRRGARVIAGAAALEPSRATLPPPVEPR